MYVVLLLLVLGILIILLYENEIAVSGIISRRDQLNEMAEMVNVLLYEKTTELGIGFISHENIKTDTHLNPKGLHLNHQGTILLSENIIKCVNM